MTKQAKKTTNHDELPSFLNQAARKVGLPEKKAEIKAKQPKAKVHKLTTKKAKSAPKAKDAAPAKGSVVPASFKTKAGKAGIMNADDLGAAIKNAFLAAGSNDRSAQESARDAVDALLTENGLDVGRWTGRNPGMLRMNVSNVLRAMRRNGENVLVRGKVFKAA